MASALVVDTSVLVKWFKTEDEDFTAEARALLERVERARAEVYAPALLLYEVGNILTRKSDLDDAAVADVLAGIAASSLIVAPPEPAPTTSASTTPRSSPSPSRSTARSSPPTARWPAARATSASCATSRTRRICPERRPPLGRRRQRALSPPAACLDAAASSLSEPRPIP